MLKRNIILNIIGLVFFILGIAAIINAFYIGRYQHILWFCYISLIIMGIAILLRNSFLLASQINILAIPLIIWSFDFIYFLIMKQSLFGITDYFFAEWFPILSKIISSQHLFTIPLSLYALYLLKLKRNDAWKLSFIYLIILFFVSLIFTSPEKNINCIYRSCINFTINFYYPVVWLIASGLMIFLTNFIVVRFFKNEIRR